MIRLARLLPPVLLGMALVGCASVPPASPSPSSTGDATWRMVVPEGTTRYEPLSLQVPPLAVPERLRAAARPKRRRGDRAVRGS